MFRKIFQGQDAILFEVLVQIFGLDKRETDSLNLASHIHIHYILLCFMISAILPVYHSQKI